MNIKDVCLFGDSIAKGVIFDSISNKYKFLKNSFAEICKSTYNVSVKNFSKFGSTISNGLLSLDKHVKDIPECSYAFLEFGGNDSDFKWDEVSNAPDEKHIPNVPSDEFMKNYTQMINSLKSYGVKPILLSLPPIDSDKYFNAISKNRNPDNILKWLDMDKHYIYRWHEIYNMLIFKLGLATSLPVVDITTPFLEKSDYSKYLCDDGVHPNGEGHKLIADTICNFVTVAAVF